MEKIYIVNDQDEVIGEKFRELILPNDIYRISGLWLKDRHGNVLLAKRSMTKRINPGKWGPAVVGTVGVGETYESNIIKESFEEIGLTVSRPALGPKMKMFTDQFKLFVQWYVLILDKRPASLALEKGEVDDAQWFTVQEIKELHLTNPDIFVKSVAWCIDNL